MQEIPKAQAIAMRRAGRSYHEITAALGVPKGTLSGWFNREGWSAAIRRDLERATRPMHRARIAAMSRARSEKFATLRAGAREEARRRFPGLVRDALFLIGIALYWGEGDKRWERGAVRVSNIDPDLLRVFVRFLVVHGGVPVERLRVGVLVYPDLDPLQCQRHWSRTLGLPLHQFHKTQIIIGRSPLRRLTHGVCMVSVCSRLLAEQIAEWTSLLAVHLLRANRNGTVASVRGYRIAVDYT